MSEVDKLNAQIAELEQMAEQAEADQQQAEADYQRFIESGDLEAAQGALSRKQAGSTQVYRDRITALEATRKDAERADRTPAAMAKMDAARTAVEAEGEAHSRFGAALDEFKAAFDTLRHAYSATDSAIETAQQALRDAHLYTHDAVERPRLEIDASAVQQLAQWLPRIRQERDGIPLITASPEPRWTPPSAEPDTTPSPAQGIRFNQITGRVEEY